MSLGARDLWGYDPGRAPALRGVDGGHAGCRSRRGQPRRSISAFPGELRRRCCAAGSSSSTRTASDDRVARNARRRVTTRRASRRRRRACSLDFPACACIARTATRSSTAMLDPAFEPRAARVHPGNSARPAARRLNGPAGTANVVAETTRFAHHRSRPARRRRAAGDRRLLHRLASHVAAARRTRTCRRNTPCCRRITVCAAFRWPPDTTDCGWNTARRAFVVGAWTTLVSLAVYLGLIAAVRRADRRHRCSFSGGRFRAVSSDAGRRMRCVTVRWSLVTSLPVTERFGDHGLAGSPAPRRIRRPRDVVPR